jgi:hypothetical protein
MFDPSCPRPRASISGIHPTVVSHSQRTVRHNDHPPPCDASRHGTFSIFHSPPSQPLRRLSFPAHSSPERSPTPLRREPPRNLFHLPFSIFHLPFPPFTAASSSPIPNARSPQRSPTALRREPPRNLFHLPFSIFHFPLHSPFEISTCGIVVSINGSPDVEYPSPR